MVASVVLYLLLAATASAEVDQHGGGWIIVSATGDFEAASPKLARLKYWFDSQVRFLADEGGYYQSLIRPGLGWGVFKRGAVWVGYNWLRTDLEGIAPIDEQQVWEQFTWSEPAGDWSRLWRTRLEQRFVSGADDVGVRLRQLFRTSIPIQKGSPLSVAAYDEVFFNLNDTDWGREAGFDQNRFFIGMAWKLLPKLGTTLEIGYMNQYIDAPSGPNQLNHLVTATIAFN